MCNRLKKSPESDNCFETGILVLRVDSIYDIISERILLSCLLLLIVGSSHLILSATEHCTNIKFCVLLHRSPLETLRLLEEACCKAAMKETRVCEWHKHFYDGPHCRLELFFNAQNLVHYEFIPEGIL
jgi:hypothetical protein